eukprot:221764-Rhodomonas_salina.2
MYYSSDHVRYGRVRIGTQLRDPGGAAVGLNGRRRQGQQGCGQVSVCYGPRLPVLQWAPAYSAVSYGRRYLRFLCTMIPALPMGLGVFGAFASADMQGPGGVRDADLSRRGAALVLAMLSKGPG